MCDTESPFVTQRVTSTLETQLMAKRAAKTKSPTWWISQLNPDDIKGAHEEATTDAYGDFEQHTGFMTLLEEDLVFPFNVKFMAETRTVVGMAWPEDSEFGLDLLIEHNGSEHRVDASSVEVLEPFPDGHVTLAAYLKWRRFV